MTVERNAAVQKEDVRARMTVAETALSELKIAES